MATRIVAADAAYRGGGGERIAMALIASLVICFLSFLFVGRAPATSIIGVPDGHAPAQTFSISERPSSERPAYNVQRANPTTSKSSINGLFEEGNAE